MASSLGSGFGNLRLGQYLDESAGSGDPEVMDDAIEADDVSDNGEATGGSTIAASESGPSDPFDDDERSSFTESRRVSGTTTRHAPRREGSQAVRPGKSRLVIAIDFGTTYTGLAYSVTDGGTIGNVEVLQDWGAGMGNADKIRSIYSYARSEDGSLQWGSRIDDHATAMVNTKLELEPRETRLDELEATWHLLQGTGKLSFAHIASAGPNPAFTPYPPTRIITDFLTQVCKVATKPENIDLRQLVTTRTPVDIIITVPVGWSFAAMNSTFRAFRDAGFNRDTFPTLQNTILVSEPEAAAYFTAKHLQDIGRVQFLVPDECFVLCDAGGGTVDVVSLKVNKTGSTLEFEKATEPNSERCGSIFIDYEFKKWLRRIIGRPNYEKLDTSNKGQRLYPFAAESGALRKLMRDFEVQKAFFTSRTQVIKLDLPSPLDKLTIGHGDVVNEGEVTISRTDMLKFFEDSIDGTLRLIDEQITKVEDNHYQRWVFLVGGFGASSFLQEKLEMSLRKRSTRGIPMVRPEQAKSWTAVVCGAVIYGIEKHRFKQVENMMAMTKSYGILVDDRSERGSQQWKFSWLARKGDLVLQHQMRTIHSDLLYFHPNQWQPNGHYSMVLYEYSKPDDDVPDRYHNGLREVKEAMKVNCSIPLTQIPISTGNRNDAVVGPFTCRLQIIGNRLQMEVLKDDTPIGQSTIEIELDSPVMATSRGNWPRKTR